MNYKGYTNPQLLFTPEQLRERLNDPKLCLIDVRLSHEFARGHIPGAIHFDLYGISLIDTGPEASRAFMWMFQYLYQHRGIDFDKTVVFYENTSGMKAARAFWFLEYFGHDDVHVLDGGFNAWVESGYPVTTETIEPKMSNFQARHQPELFWNAEDVLKHLNDPDVMILDTRTDDEYYARNVRAARGGAIPRAIHIEWVHNLDKKGAFKSANELKAMYEAAGVTPDKDVVSY
jgi:thiosulfate/3-mercaptopyruvate sulfurtransferase